MSETKTPPILGWRSLDWGVIVTLFVQIAVLIYWASGVEAQVKQNTRDLLEVQAEVNDVESDIRAILVGIEQVKARLGIIESFEK